MTGRAPFLAIALVAVTVSACGTLSVRAPEVSASILSAGATEGFDMHALERGRRLYASACARCHALPRIGDHTAAQWASIEPSMTVKSRLEDASARELWAYVRACVAVEARSESE